jgi:hypothetical protein
VHYSRCDATKGITPIKYEKRDENFQRDINCCGHDGVVGDKRRTYSGKYKGVSVMRERRIVRGTRWNGTNNKEQKKYLINDKLRGKAKNK